MRLVLTLSLVLALCISSVAFATEAYYYGETAISVLTEIKDATSTPVNQHQDGLSMIRASMKNSIAQTNAFKSAEYKISQFSKSSDPEIQQSVALFSGVILMLRIASEQNTAEFEKLLNMPPKEFIESQGTVYRGIFELQKTNESNWEAYAEVAGMAVTFALTDSVRLDGDKIAYLKITADERKKLKDQLVSSFGKKIKNGITKDTYMNEIPAAVFWKFLNDKWLAKDNK